MVFDAPMLRGGKGKESILQPGISALAGPVGSATSGLRSRGLR